MNNNQSLLQEVLGRYGLTEAHVTPLHSYNHQVYRVEGTNGQRFSLRICGFLNMQRSAMEDEMRWLAFVAQHNPRLAPRPIANQQGELVTDLASPEGERLACLFAWIEGEDLLGRVTPARMFKIGRALAALHNIAREFPFPDAASDFRGGYRYDQSLMRSHYGWIDERRATIGAENVALLHRAIEYAITAMDRMGTTPANYGIIHADPSFGNFLTHAEEIYVIDFEQLGRGHFHYDLAVLWSELHEISADFDPLWQSLVAGYQEVAEFPVRQEVELQPFIMALHLNFLDWFYNSMNSTTQVKFAPQVPITYESIRQRLQAVGI